MIGGPREGPRIGVEEPEGGKLAEVGVAMSDMKRTRCRWNCGLMTW